MTSSAAAAKPPAAKPITALSRAVHNVRSSPQAPRRGTTWHKTSYSVELKMAQRALLLLLLLFASGFAPAHSVSTSRLTCVDSLSTAQCQQLQATQGCTFVQPPGDTNFAGLVAHYCRATCGQCNVPEAGLYAIFNTFVNIQSSSPYGISLYKASTTGAID